MRRFLTSLSSVAVIAILACNHATYFGRNVISRYSLSTEDIRQLQFYIGDDITLLADSITRAEAGRSGRAVTSRRERERDFVFVKHGTPAIARNVGEGWAEVDVGLGLNLWFSEEAGVFRLRQINGVSTASTILLRGRNYTVERGSGARLVLKEIPENYRTRTRVHKAPGVRH